MTTTTPHSDGYPHGPVDASPLLRQLQSHADALSIMQIMLKLHMGAEQYNSLVAKAYEERQKPAGGVDPDTIKSELLGTMDERLQGVSHEMQASVRESMQECTNMLVQRTASIESSMNQRVDHAMQAIADNQRAFLEQLQAQQAAQPASEPQPAQPKAEQNKKKG